MNYLLIRHKVANFKNWKAAYDAHASVRKSAGIAELHLRRNIADSNEVILLFSATDLDKAKAFAASDDLRTAMQKAGVIGQPDVLFLE